MEKAALLKPGESGLLALDWWNGNRSILVDVDLTGMLLGATLLTRPEEIYRTFTGLGGETGWLYMDWAWRVRCTARA